MQINESYNQLHKSYQNQQVDLIQATVDCQRYTVEFSHIHRKLYHQSCIIVKDSEKLQQLEAAKTDLEHENERLKQALHELESTQPIATGANAVPLLQTPPPLPKRGKKRVRKN